MYVIFSVKEFHAIAVNFADKITCEKIELNNYFDNRQLNFTTIKKLPSYLHSQFSFKFYLNTIFTIMNLSVMKIK